MLYNALKKVFDWQIGVAKDFWQGVGDLVKGPSEKVGSYIDNAFTGSRDYQRSMDTLAAENAFTAQQNEISRNFNAEEAEKARAFQRDLQDNQILSTASQLRELGINPYAVLSGSNAVAPSAVSAYSSSQGSSHAPTYQSGQQVTNFLAGMVNSAFGLARASMYANSMLSAEALRVGAQNRGYKDTYFDRDGRVSGGRWRDFD